MGSFKDTFPALHTQALTLADYKRLQEKMNRPVSDPVMQVRNALNPRPRS